MYVHKDTKYINPIQLQQCDHCFCYANSKVIIKLLDLLRFYHRSRKVALFPWTANVPAVRLAPMSAITRGRRLYTSWPVNNSLPPPAYNSYLLGCGQSHYMVAPTIYMALTDRQLSQTNAQYSSRNKHTLCCILYYYISILWLWVDNNHHS